MARSCSPATSRRRPSATGCAAAIVADWRAGSTRPTRRARARQSSPGTGTRSSPADPHLEPRVRRAPGRAAVRPRPHRALRRTRRRLALGGAPITPARHPRTRWRRDRERPRTLHQQGSRAADEGSEFSIWADVTLVERATRRHSQAQRQRQQVMIDLATCL